MAVILALAAQGAQMLLVLLLAPLLTGFIRKLKARLLRRRGSPILQPYRDLLRLMRKEAVLAENASWLFRVLSIREIDAGSCNGCELEIHSLGNAFYDLERFGLRFVASPRHADVLLVTGPVTKNMREALLRTYEAAPAPKWVVAAGACPLDGGIFAGGYACVGGVSAAIPVDVHIPGCPPTPIALLNGLLALMMDGRG
jgi:Ni,Fe-hydrogenase III small subunit